VLAALTITPVLAALPASNTPAALTVSPSFTAAGSAANGTQTGVAALTVACYFTAAVVASLTAQAALTVTPAFTLTTVRTSSAAQFGLLMAAGII
jgi:hypothetical protein